MESSLEIIGNEETKQLEGRATNALEQAKRLVIDVQADYEQAARLMSWTKNNLKQGEAITKPFVKSAHEAHKAAKAWENELLQPLKDAYEIARKKSTTWYTAQERIRLEKERQAREEAEAIEEANKKAIEEVAKEAEKEGDIAKAEEIRAKKEEVFIPVAKEESVKVAGQSYRSNWKARITDKSKIPLEFMEPNMQKLNAFAREFKEESQLPGVGFYDDKVLVQK